MIRVLLVGDREARARLRAVLATADVEIAGEAASLASARAMTVRVDGILMAPGDLPRPIPGEDEDDLAVVEALTPREIEVLELLAQGLPNKAIAARLAISDQTVKFHVASIYGKLGAANRTDAVRRALRRGVITI
jgi:ATP/maltotriose-dependent transcriptional regulator MalT